jgi:hypothetical protein
MARQDLYDLYLRKLGEDELKKEKSMTETVINAIRESDLTITVKELFDCCKEYDVCENDDCDIIYIEALDILKLDNVRIDSPTFQKWIIKEEYLCEDEHPVSYSVEYTGACDERYSTPTVGIKEDTYIDTVFNTWIDWLESRLFDIENYLETYIEDYEFEL